MADKRQIKLIHTIKNRLGMSDEEYRKFLMENTHGFSISSLELSFQEAEEIIEKMKQLAMQKGVWKEYINKYSEYEGREYMATPAQLRKIEVSIFRNEKRRAKALRRLMKRLVGVDDLRFLKQWQVKKIVKALETMKAKKDKCNDIG